jgi:hypothetical protein
MQTLSLVFPRRYNMQSGVAKTKEAKRRPNNTDCHAPDACLGPIWHCFDPAMTAIFAAFVAKQLCSR